MNSTLMNKFVIDSWAWVEYLRGSSRGGRVRELLEEKKNELFTHAVSVAEVVSKLRRANLDYGEAWRAIASNSKIVIPSGADAFETGLLHASMKRERRNFSLADTFVLLSARQNRARVLTGDPDFSGLTDAIFVG